MTAFSHNKIFLTFVKQPLYNGLSAWRRFFVTHSLLRPLKRREKEGSGCLYRFPGKVYSGSFKDLMATKSRLERKIPMLKNLLVRCLFVAAFVAACSCGASSGDAPCAPGDLKCWLNVSPPGGEEEGRGFLSTAGGFLRTLFLLGAGIFVWNGVKVIPNEPRVLYHIQRSLQLFLVPFLIFIFGVGLGGPGQGFFLALASFLYTPWYLRETQVDQGGGQAAVQVEETEAWPVIPAWLRYVLASLALAVGLASC